MVLFIVARFKQYLLELGYSKSTVNMLPACVLEFLEFINKSIKDISKSDIVVFYEYLQTRPLKRRTGVLSEAMINHYIFSLKTFFSWLEQTGQIHQNPMSTLVFKRPKSHTREPLSQAQIQALFVACESPKETAILHLFYSCGLRRTEAETLNTNDIHLNQNRLYVRAGKGAKRRAIPLTEKVKEALREYLDSRFETLDRRYKIVNEAFMLNSRGSRMKGNQFNTMLKNILKKSQISHLKSNVSLHHLRHSIATHLLENGLSLEFVRDFLGHRHLEATQIYTKVKTQQLKHL